MNTKIIQFKCLLLLLVGCLAGGCSSGSDEDADYTLSVSKSVLSFPYEGGALDLQVTAIVGSRDAAWTADASNAGFVTLEPASGKGSARITVVAERNEDGSNRTGTIVFKCGTQSQVVEVAQDANLIKECYAEPVDTLTMSTGVACGVRIGNSCHNYYIALYEESVFQNLQDNEIEDEIKKQSAKKLYPDYPKDLTDNRLGTDYQDIVAWFKDVKPGTNYVIVTSAYTKEGIHGEIRVLPVSTCADDFQPVVEMSDFQSTQVNGKNCYLWNFGMNTFCNSYYTYVCAGSDEFPTYSSEYPDVVLAWRILREIPNVPSDMRHATQINRMEGGSAVREYLFPKMRASASFSDMESNESDRYLQVVAWGLAENGISSKFSGKITVMRIPVNKSELSVVTNDASDIFSTSATLNGGVIGADGSVEVGFEYGVSASSLIMSTDTRMLANGSFSMDVKGLSANTTYYYRAFARQNGQKVYGSIKHFTTLTEMFNKDAFDSDIKL